MDSNENIIIKEIIIYKTYTPAQARAQKKWLSNPENKEKVRQYYKRRFEEDEAFRERLREKGRERAKRCYYKKKVEMEGNKVDA